MTRAIPHNTTVYATCWMTLFYPQLGERIRAALQRLGIRAQPSPHLACCGWQSYTAGDWEQAIAEADAWVRAHLSDEAIVVPSPACTTLLRHHVMYLFADSQVALDRARDLRERIWELGEFLNALRAPVVGADRETWAYVAGCREGARAGEVWLRQHLGERLVTLGNLCCADGGIFPVEMPELTGAMIARLVHRLRESQVTRVVTDEPACHFLLKRALASTSIHVHHLIDVVPREV